MVGLTLIGPKKQPEQYKKKEKKIDCSY